MLEGHQSYENYFSALCTAHKSLGAGKFIFGDDDVAINKAKGWDGLKMWLEEPEPSSVVDAGSDNYLCEQKGIVLIGGAPADKSFAAEQTKYRECFTVMKDIISKMIQDYDGFAALIKRGSIRFGKAEMMFSSTNFIFCRMEFIYDDPTGFPYTEANWN